MQPLREVYSLLMPVQDGRIIVPRAAVAEVMGYTRPRNRPDDAPGFVLGFIEWQGKAIPLVSFEAARGKGVPELGRRTRIAVVFGIAGRLDPDVFAIVTQGYPYLVRVNENVLQREEMETDEPLVLARVRMANEKPYIPNFEKLERLIADGLGIQAPDGGDAGVQPVDELDLPDVGEDAFDAGALTDVTDAAGESPDTGAANFDLGEVTAFGTETSYSDELEALSGALDSDDADATDGQAEVDLGEVTAFGIETNYSVELDALSEALPEEGAQDDDSEPVIDFSALELDTEEPAVMDDDNGNGDAGEIDISGLALDDEDEDDRKKKKDQ